MFDVIRQNFQYFLSFAASFTFTVDGSNYFFVGIVEFRSTRDAQWITENMMVCIQLVQFTSTDITIDTIFVLQSHHINQLTVADAAKKHYSHVYLYWNHIPWTTLMLAGFIWILGNTQLFAFRSKCLFLMWVFLGVQNENSDGILCEKCMKLLLIWLTFSLFFLRSNGWIERTLF